MAEPVSIQTLLTYLTLISVPVGVLYHIMTLRNQSKTRKTQLFMEVYNKFNDTVEKTQENLEFNRLEFDGYDDFIEKYSWGINPRFWAKLYHTMMFYEGIGLLVKRGLIDIEMVEDFMSGVIMGFWGKYGPILKEFGARRNYPTFGEWTEYLYNQIRPIYERQHGIEGVRRYVPESVDP
jgi:hypothetical protein